MTFLAEERGARGLDPNAELLFHRRLQEKNAASLSLGAWLATFFIPIFWALDWMVVPDHVWLTGALRALCTLACLAIVVAYRVHRKWVLRAVDWLAPALEVLIGVSIAAMTWLHEGYESPYYAGLNLTVICAGFLFSWPLRTAIVAHGSVYLLYMLPMLVGIITVDDAAIVLNNQFFLVGTIVIILASQRYRYILEGRQFQANYDLQKTKASLEDALERLKEADRLKTRFFGNITHELRTPLTLILAPLESLLSGDMGALSAAQTTYIEGIRKSALKLLKLISDLLDLARLGERYMTLNLVPTELASLLRELVEHARPLAARKNIELSVEIRSPQVNLEVDPEKLERVLVNLLSNALKFTPEGGRVGIWMEAEARVVRVGVHDTGIGIPEDKLKKIFERFVQADGSVTRRFGGTGIGLAFAQEIVDLHGGTIQVHSMEGEGSTFVVELPSVAPAGRREGPAARAPEVVARTRTPRTPAPEQVDWTRQILEREEYRFLQLHEVTERRIAERSDDAGKGTNILVVEDNVEVLRFIHHELQPEHRVYLAQDGAQGLELALREIPDVIISDYMMPVMDGPTMVRALRANPVTAEIPVVMLTARNTPEDRTEGREAGADVYIAKPFSPRELRGSIRELLKKRGRLATTVL